VTDAALRIAIVTRSWGTSDDGAELTRLVAGALARCGDVEILHCTDTRAPAVRAESVFTVHAVPLLDAHPERSAIAVAAATVGDAPVPPAIVDLLERWEGTAPGVPALLKEIDPDVVVLAGASQPWELGCLGVAGRRDRPRVVALPMLGANGIALSRGLSGIVEVSDVVATIHPGEHRALAAEFGDRVLLTPLDIALPLNRSATAQGLFGVGWFGPYAVVIRRFPADGGRYADSVTHDVLRSALGGVAVAEVDGGKWRIADAENTAELPVNPTRVNLWRLMANGLMTIDLRPPDRFGREAIESMLLGTPVVVPDKSAAMEHAAAADGGLWYRNLGEVLDCAEALCDEGIRLALGRQGSAYAQAHHGAMDAFVGRCAALAGR
jgi:hypothetical protein